MSYGAVEAVGEGGGGGGGKEWGTAGVRSGQKKEERI